MSSIRFIFRSRIVWAIILLLLFLVVFIFSDKYAGIVQLKEDIRKLEGEIEALKTENENLSKEVELLKSDQYIEKIAREELELSKPDEIILKAIEK